MPRNRPCDLWQQAHWLQKLGLGNGWFTRNNASRNTNSCVWGDKRFWLASYHPHKDQQRPQYIRQSLVS